MARLTAAGLADLSKALSESYVSDTQLSQFLLTRLDRRFNDLSSRYVPLSQSITEIVQRAQEQGWVVDLVHKAAADRPQNATLRALRDAVPMNGDDTSIRRSHIDRPSLLCGRASQWNEVSQFALVRPHQVILVPAARGQEPMHFRDRIHVWLTPDPSRIMVVISWPTPPKSFDEMKEQLAVALGVGVDGLAQRLVEKLAYQNLVLLHPCITEGFKDTHFVEYYTSWLPSLLARPTAGSLKCVQPIEWPIQPSGGGLLGRLFSARSAASPHRDEALQLIKALHERQAPHLRVLDVDELENLQPREVEQFLEGSEFPLEHQPILRAQLQGGPQISGYMFKTIDDYWKNLYGAR